MTPGLALDRLDEHGDRVGVDGVFERVQVAVFTTSKPGV
jgi:hypothetical protein